MTMKRILHCTLIYMVLVTSGCGFFSDESTSKPKANSSPTPETQNKADAASAQTDVQGASTRSSSAGRAGPSATVTPGRNQSQRDSDTGDDKLNQTTQPATTTPSPTPSTTQTPVKAETVSDEFDWWSTLVLALKIAGVLAVLVLLASALSYLWKRSWKTIELNVGRVVVAHLAATREAQPDYAPKLSSLSSAQEEISSRLTELDTEVRSLARLVRESFSTRRSDGNPSYSSFNYQSHVQNVAPKDEPEFPVSAVDYLGKMNRFANVVRPDFQNGILVNDPDGTGELVLIRDSRDDTQPLFVVPSLTQFQTKQDFYTYYQKYYDCARPSAGDVWIVGPAVVERVEGGWQLREKGMLEIR
jgi:hypothetical protein